MEREKFNRSKEIKDINEVSRKFSRHISLTSAYSLLQNLGVSEDASQILIEYINQENTHDQTRRLTPKNR